MPKVTRIVLNKKYAEAISNAAEASGVSQTEVVRMALRHYWGEFLQHAPSSQN